MTQMTSPPRHIPNPLITFEVPDAHVIAEIQRILAALPVVDSSSAFRSRSEPSRVTILGDIEVVVSSLARELQADHLDNRVEADEGGFSFRYLVTREVDLGPVIAVTTTLFHPDKLGTISYSRRIRRISSDQFELESDE